MGGSTDREGRVEVCVGGRRWRTVCTGIVKNWQELFVHKWDTSLKVTEDEDHNDIALNSISTYLQEAQWQHSTHFLLEHFQSTD